MIEIIKMVESANSVLDEGARNRLRELAKRAVPSMVELCNAALEEFEPHTIGNAEMLQAYNFAKAIRDVLTGEATDFFGLPVKREL